MIELKRVFAHLLTELWLIIKDRLELSMAHTIGVDMHHGFVCVLSLLSEQVFIATDDALGAQFDMEVLRLLVHREADAVLSGRGDRLPRVPADHEDEFIDLLSLFKDILTLLVVARFKRSQVVDHEL